MATKKIYNINAMREVLLAARKDGNRKMITAKFCAEHNVAEGYFTMFRNTIQELYEVTSNYCRLKNSQGVAEETLKEAHDKIYPLWKSLLETAEKDKLKKDLHCTEHDISNLVSFCQKFTSDRNDESRGTDKEFCAQKVWAIQPIAQFQKFIETDLGIRIEKIEVLSDEQRDYLRAEGKILRQWGKAEKRIRSYEAQIDLNTKEIKKAKTDEMKNYFKEQNANLKKKIAEAEAKIVESQTAYDKLKAEAEAKAK